MAIINSLLDNDLYKFTMMQAVLHEFPDVNVEYTFKNRDSKINLTPYIDEIETEIDLLCQLRFLPEELTYLEQLSFIKKDFVDFLNLFRLNRNHIFITTTNNELQISIRGSWLLTILFEVPVLAIISEVYSHNVTPNPDIKGAKQKILDKIEIIKNLEGFRFADFGTRRRFSFTWQQELIRNLLILNDKQFVGTSNVYFAKKFNIRPIGTMAHEFLQAGQAVGVRLIDSQKFMLQKWVDEYRGNLGIALSDVISFDAFLADFDLYFSKLYDGVRQDSGNPYEACEKLITHYKSMNIDPKMKAIVFSDGLNINTAANLLKQFKDKIQVSFGIGTNLTNDVPNHEPLKIVIKMTRCNGQPVAKISDTDEKGMCDDEEYLKYLKKVFIFKMKPKPRNL